MSIKQMNTQEGLYNKICYQKSLLEQYPNVYKIGFGGAATYVGEIPKGCYECLSYRVKTYSGCVSMYSKTPNYCTADCPYCFFKKGDGTNNTRAIVNDNMDVSNCVKEIDSYIKTCNPAIDYYTIKDNIKDFLFAVYNFTGFASEPLLYIDAIEHLMFYYTKSVEQTICSISEQKGCFKLYTNGFLLDDKMCRRLKKAGFTEIRVNVAAHKFMDDVYDNIKNATQYFDSIYIEVPVYPLYKDELIKMMEIAGMIGVTGINLCQMKFNNSTVLESIAKTLPNYGFYRATPNYFMLDDKGFTEELIRIGIENSYDYSILDCNAFTLQYKPNNIVFNLDKKVGIV